MIGQLVRCELKRKVNEAVVMYFEVLSLNLPLKQGKALNISEDWMVSTVELH